MLLPLPAPHTTAYTPLPCHTATPPYCRQFFWHPGIWCISLLFLLFSRRLRRDVVSPLCSDKLCVVPCAFADIEHWNGTRFWFTRTFSTTLQCSHPALAGISAVCCACCAALPRGGACALLPFCRSAPVTPRTFPTPYACFFMVAATPALR
jgi:hypothetical protein